MSFYDREVFQFLKDNKDLVEEKKFDALYFYALNMLGNYAIHQITEILLQVINPLNYMSSIPTDYLRSTSKIDQVEIPEGIKIVGARAFRVSKSIKNIEFPSTLIELDRDVFFNSNIERVDLIKTKVQTLPAGTFVGCDNLKSLYLPKTLAQIDKACFDEIVTKLKDIYYPGTSEEFLKIRFDSVPECKYRVHCSDMTLEMGE